MNYIEKGTKQVRHAIELDEQGDLSQAYHCYLKALSWFEMELKHGKNPSTKVEVRNKMWSYLERAEQIKMNLRKEKNPQKEHEEPVDDAMSRALQSTIVTDVDPVQWSDVAGLDEAKKSLKEAVILPIQAPHLFQDGTQTWKGILLYGPPGTGKSYVARAVATEAKATFFSLSASRLVSKWLGESEQLVRTLFEMARARAPSIIFIDEIDALLKSRSAQGTHQSMARVVGEFLTQLDGVGNDQRGVVVLGATNLPWDLDPAVMRQGRFDRKIYIPLPNSHARTQLFRIHAKSALSNEEIKQLVDVTDGCSGSDVAGICKAAAMRPLRKLQEATHFRLHGQRAYPCDATHKDAVAMSWEEFDDMSILEKPPIVFPDYVDACRATKSSVPLGLLQQYRDWTAEFGMK